jgi:hypothetical protein
MPEEPITQETPAAEPDPQLTAMQQQITELREQVAESNRTAQFWAQQARERGAPAPVAVEPEDDSTDVLEAITTEGVKGFDQLAAKRGFIKRDEVETMMNRRTAEVTKEQELIQEYPDLKKKDSEFFKATALNYGALVRSGTPKEVAMELAAKQTELTFLREGKMKVPGEVERERREAERLDRVRAQSGENGRRPAPGSEDTDPELDAQQRHICDQMGVSYDAYKRRAQAGVAIRGTR